MRRSFGTVVLLVVLAAAVSWLAWRSRDQLQELVEPVATQPPAAVVATREVPSRDRVTALGRIRPGDGVVHVAGPARFAVVVSELTVAIGSWVEAGDVIAILDTVGPQEAEVSVLEAELALAEIELERGTRMTAEGIETEAELDRLKARRDIVAAHLESARAELVLSHVRAPMTGRVLDIHTRAGERVGTDGIVELADTRRMFAVAEVYESDITRVHRGARAHVTSPALPAAGLDGVVDRVGLKVARKDVLDSDPIADADARVVEVDVLLDDPKAAERLTNLRVEVVIEVAEPAP